MTAAKLTQTTKANQLAVQVGHGNNRAAGTVARALFESARGNQQVRTGTCTGNGSNLNEIVQSTALGTWTPNCVVLVRNFGSAVYIGHDGIGAAKAAYIRGDASTPDSMGLEATLGVTMRSNGFSIGDTISVSAKVYSYIAFRAAPEQSA